MNRRPVAFGSMTFCGWRIDWGGGASSSHRRQASETVAGKRREMLYQIQRTLHDRRRFAPIYDYMWASGTGPRVEEPALVLINPYPWSAPLEDVRVKRP